MSKINITMSADVLEQVDFYAGKCGMTRSGFISLSARSYIDSLKFSNLLDELSAAVKRLGSGNNDEEILSEMNKLITCINLINPNKQ